MLGNPLTDSSLDLHISITNSSLPQFFACFFIAPSSLIIVTFCITYAVLLFPLCVFVLYHGFQERCKKPSASTAPSATHTDSFTYNVAIMGLIGVFGVLLSCCAVCIDKIDFLMSGTLLSSVTLNGEAFFQVLTCVEWYLAVVHPVTYLSLRTKKWVRIRNTSTGCSWLLCFMGMGLLIIEKLYSIIDLCFLITAIIIVAFCSLSVLCVLIRPGPGEQGGDKESVDQSKKKAFYIILVILGVLVLRFVWGLARVTTFLSNRDNKCVIMTSGFLFYLPSSLVLPVLFVHRTMCCKNSRK